MSEPAKKQFARLPKKEGARVLAYLYKVENVENPRLFGRALVGPAHRWRYRVGDYRIICELRDSELIVLVIDIDHRSSVYR